MVLDRITYSLFSFSACSSALWQSWEKGDWHSSVLWLPYLEPSLCYTYKWSRTDKESCWLLDCTHQKFSFHNWSWDMGNEKYCGLPFLRDTRAIHWELVGVGVGGRSEEGSPVFLATPTWSGAISRLKCGERERQKLAEIQVNSDSHCSHCDLIDFLK